MYYDYCTVALIWHASKIMFKILQARLQQYMNCELPDVQAWFRKGKRNQRSNCQNPLDHRKSKRVPEKHLFLLYWLCQSQSLLWITTNYGKFFKRWEYQTTWPASWETCMKIRVQQLEVDMEQQIGSKSGKEYIKSVYSHLLQNFPQFNVIHTVKGFGIVNKAEVDVFLKLSCFFDDPADVGNLISGSSLF